LAVVSEPAEVADAVVAAIQRGDVAGLRRILKDHPAVASAPLGARYKTRTPLQVVTDWPGYFPNGPEIVQVLVQARADPDARQPGDETPLQWAASSDDMHVAAALIDAGADINAPHGSVGTTVADAVGYCCWEVARLLVSQGARVDDPPCGGPRRMSAKTGWRHTALELTHTSRLMAAAYMPPVVLPRPACVG